MADGNSETPIGDEVDQWLRSKKPDKPIEESQTQNNDSEQNIREGLTQVMDFIQKSKNSKKELPERERRLYAENERYRTASDMYHDSLSVLSRVPAFRDAVVVSQREIFERYDREQLRKLNRGEAVTPILQMLPAIFRWGVKAQFKINDDYYEATVFDSNLSVSKSSRSVNIPSYTREPIVEKKKLITEYLKDPNFRYEIFTVSLDNGEDDPGFRSIGDAPPRDYIHDNKSDVEYHDYRMGIPTGEDWWNRRESLPGTPVNKDDIGKVNQILNDIESGLLGK